MKLSERTANLWSGVVSLLIGLFYLYLNVTSLDFWTPGNQPGPGFFPMLVGIAVVGISCTLIWKGLRTPAEAGSVRDSFDRESLKKPLLVFAGLVVAVVLFETLGYVLSMWISVGGLMWAFIPSTTLKRRAIVSIGISGAAVWVFYLAFGVGFGLELPPFLPFLS